MVCTFIVKYIIYVYTYIMSNDRYCYLFIFSATSVLRIFYSWTRRAPVCSVGLVDGTGGAGGVFHIINKGKYCNSPLSRLRRARGRITRVIVAKYRRVCVWLFLSFSLSISLRLSLSRSRLRPFVFWSRHGKAIAVVRFVERLHDTSVWNPHNPKTAEVSEDKSEPPSLQSRTIRIPAWRWLVGFQSGHPRKAYCLLQQVICLFDVTSRVW